MEDEEYHTCHFCGTEVKDGREYNGTRHYLSDCRPDLVEHEIGDKCTWSYQRDPEFKDEFKEQETCYAYQDPESGQFTTEHKYFHKDGPM